MRAFCTFATMLGGIIMRKFLGKYSYIIRTLASKWNITYEIAANTFLHNISKIIPAQVVRDCHFRARNSLHFDTDEEEEMDRRRKKKGFLGSTFAIHSLEVNVMKCEDSSILLCNFRKYSRSFILSGNLV